MLFTIISRVGQRRSTTYIFGNSFDEVQKNCISLYGKNLISVSWEPKKDEKFKEKLNNYDKNLSNYEEE